MNDIHIAQEMCSWSCKWNRWSYLSRFLLLLLLLLLLLPPLLPLPLPLLLLPPTLLLLLILLLQPALQPLWVLVCSTIVEYSQQGGFYRVPLPTARQTPNLEDQGLESPASETTQANPSSGRWNYGREISENVAESGDFHVTFGFFYMP